jgi:hypothetical protein
MLPFRPSPMLSGWPPIREAGSVPNDETNPILRSRLRLRNALMERRKGSAGSPDRSVKLAAGTISRPGEHQYFKLPDSLTEL